MSQSSKPSNSLQRKRMQEHKLLFLDTMLDLRQEAQDQVDNDQNISSQDKCTALSRINNAQRLLYGKNSIEALHSESNLGFFYTDNSEPELALKHFNMAQNIEKKIDKVDDEDSFKIALGAAQAYLNVNKSHVGQAEKILKPYVDIPLSPYLRYRRDLLKSRIYVAQKDYSQALNAFREAQSALQEVNKGESTKEEAELYLEMSKTAEKAHSLVKDSNRLSNEYVKKAQSILSRIDDNKYNQNQQAKKQTTQRDANKVIEEEHGEKIIERETINKVTFANIPEPKPKPADDNAQSQPQSEAQKELIKELRERFNLHDYEVLGEVGSGAFAKVFKVKNKSNQNIYAAKMMTISMEDKTDSAVHQLSREVNILSKINHPAILKFIGYSPVNFKDKPKPVIVTEFATNGSLDDLIKAERNSMANEHWNDTRKLISIYGIAAAMAYLHSHEIIHRDLKPANILMDDFLFPRVADFGLSKMNHHNAESISMKSTIGFKGTPVYMAPEIWGSSEYSKACDVYAFGIIVFEIMTSELPFPNEALADLPVKIQAGVRPEFKIDIPACYKELIEACWDGDPQKRPTFESIVEKLKTDPQFITDLIDENDFLTYTDYIDEYKSSFDKNQPVIQINDYISRSINCRSKSFQKIDLSKQTSESKPEGEKTSTDDTDYHGLCPQSYYEEFNDDRKHLVRDAEGDSYKQYIVGNFFVEGIEGFPQDTDLGIVYLDKAIKAGCVEAVNYYCNLLIKGEFVTMDLDLAQSYLEPALKSHDATVYLLYARVMRKAEHFDQARKYFKKASNGGCPEGMYEYGKMCYRGEGAEPDLTEANLYFDLSKRNGCYKAYDFIIRQEKEAERKRKREEAKKQQNPSE